VEIGTYSYTTHLIQAKDRRAKCGKNGFEICLNVKATITNVIALRLQRKTPSKHRRASVGCDSRESCVLLLLESPRAKSSVMRYSGT
jgi:hypothetical protein